MNTPSSPIRVLIVEDSPTESAIIKRTINAAPDIQVIGEARDGLEGMTLLSKLQPDVICTDYYMPNMDGLDFVVHAMASHPCPILVLSIGVQNYQTENVFKMLSAGAIDVMPKPLDGLNGKDPLQAQALHEKIRQLARIGHANRQGKPAQKPSTLALRPGWKPSLFVIGGSTGAPQALEQILSHLPQDFSSPIVCVQHMSPGFIQGMAEWLNGRTKLRIEVSSDGKAILPGHVVLSQDSCHLEINSNKTCHTHVLNAGENFPSIDRLFRSAAATYGQECVGILLSGMGMDGVAGLRAIEYAGGITVAQDPLSAVIDSMPRKAIETGAVQHILPPKEIAALMSKLAHNA
ncbi:MAG: hypothetical protein RLZ63_1492 [Pseudomonadota bacterium]